MVANQFSKNCAILRAWAKLGRAIYSQPLLPSALQHPDTLESSFQENLGSADAGLIMQAGAEGYDLTVSWQVPQRWHR